MHKPLGNLGTSMTINKGTLINIKKNNKAIYIEADIGDCVIHDGLVIHGSEKNTSKYSRNAFNFSLFSKFALQNKELFQKYQKNLKIYLQNKKK